MSGFLQRITGAAMSRETRLHPLVAPVYAAARRDEVPALWSPEETQTVVLPPREVPVVRTKPSDSQLPPTSAFNSPSPFGAPQESLLGRRSTNTQETAAEHSAAQHSGERKDSFGSKNLNESLSHSRGFQPLLERISDTHHKFVMNSESPPDGTFAAFAAGKQTTDSSSRSDKAASDTEAEAPAGSPPGAMNHCSPRAGRWRRSQWKLRKAHRPAKPRDSLQSCRRPRKESRQTRRFRAAILSR